MAKLLKIAVTTWLLLSFGSSGQTKVSVVKINTSSIPMSVEFSPKGDILYLGVVYGDSQKEDTIEAHDPKTGTLIKKYVFDCTTNGYNAPFVLSKDGQEIFTTIGAEKETLIQNLHLVTGKIQKIKNDKIKSLSVGYGLALSSDSNYLAVGGGWIYIFNLFNSSIFAKGNIIENNEIGEIRSLQFSHNNKFLVSVDKYGTMTIWNPKTNEQKFNLEQSEDMRWSVSISPDDRFITASSFLLNRTHIWDAKTGKVLTTYETIKKGKITSPVFSPDGRFIVSGEPDGVWLRDSKTAKRIKSIPELFDPKENFYLLAFSPDGRYLASVTSGLAIENNVRRTIGVIRVIPFNY